MSQPFIDTRDVRRLSLVCNLLTYSHEFCCKDKSHISLLNSAVGNHPLGCQLIEALRRTQLELRGRLPLQGIEQAWHDRKKGLRSIGISTTSLSNQTQGAPLNLLKEKMDEIIIESALTQIPSTPYGKPSYTDIILACKSTWLSEQLAMLILGVAKIDSGQDRDLVLKPTNKHMSRHLRRLWFGAAFDETSLRAASIAILRLKEALSKQTPLPEKEEARSLGTHNFPSTLALAGRNRSCRPNFIQPP